MKNKKIQLFIRSIPVLLLLPFASQGQGIEITNGSSIAVTNVSGAAYIEISNGNFINNGSYTKGNETVIFSGATPSSIIGASNTDMYKLSVTNTGGVTTHLGLLTTNNLSIASGSRFTVNPARAVTVNGTLTNNAGTGGLVVISTIEGTGSLLHSTASVSATVQRYMNDADWANWKDGWHFVSSPVASQAISPNFTLSPETDYDFYCWNEPSNLWINFKNTSVSPTWNEANGSTNFVTGRGYLVAYNAASTKEFNGALNVSDVAVSGLTVTGTTQTNRSWHLLGNPFACALHWDAGSAWNFTNIAGVAKIWNEFNQSYTDLTSTPSTYIPATNGFMVQAKSGTANITIPASARVHNTQAFYKSAEAVSALKFIARNLAFGNAQESNVLFIPEATAGFDLMYDGDFLAGYGPTFYSVAGDEKLSTNSFPELTRELQIPFSFIPNEGNQFQIEVQGIETLPFNGYLLDKKTNTDHNLSLNPVYMFTSTPQDAIDRFVLHFANANAIPVSSAENLFTIKVVNGVVQVETAAVGLSKVKLADMVGHTLAIQNLKPGTPTLIPLQGKPGVYLVSVYTTTNIYSQKVVVY